MLCADIQRGATQYSFSCCRARSNYVRSQLEDYEKIGKLFLEVCREVEAEFGVKVQDSGFL